MVSPICGIQNMAQMKLSKEQKQTHRHGEQTAVAKGERKEWDWNGLGVWGWQMQTITFRMASNKVLLLYSTGNYIQSLVIDHNGR